MRYSAQKRLLLPSSVPALAALATQANGPKCSRYRLKIAGRRNWTMRRGALVSEKREWLSRRHRLSKNGGHHMTDAVDREYTDSLSLEPTEALVSIAFRMNEFIAMLSHELRYPLAPIRNAVHLMRHKQLSDTELQRLSAMLDRHSAQLVRLVDDLLDVSRLTRDTIRVQRELVDIASVMACVLEACHLAIDAHGHTLHVMLQEEPVRLTGDSV